MFDFCITDNKYPRVHFIGIGGISMSGLAEILLSEGYIVTGSDTKDSSIIERLKNLGAKIYINHRPSNVDGADLVIYTDAISKDNEELVKAFSLNIPVIDRATFLGALMKNYKNSIAVSGTHGKTTTTSMLSTILNRSTLNPTILLGGQLDEIGGNVKLGSKDYILTEACEYKGNILKYFPTMAIILNVDADHLDYFRNMDHILETFIQYSKNLDENSYLLINIDDISSQKIISSTKAKVITFGITGNPDYKAENITFSPEGYPSYTLKINGELHSIKLNVMGIHNVYNSLASIVAAHIYGISMEEIQKNISIYTGVHRRLELKGYYKGVKIIDDYAHHPTEIRATLNALKNSTTGDIYCVFQPHTYTRTKLLLDNFAESFTEADKVIITDIYAAREIDNGLIHSKDLANAIFNNGSDAVYLGSFEEVEDYLLNNAKENDIILTMGAGNVYLVGDSIIEHNKEKTAV
ncbi:UDP-N-acetylmuramate--L-alanine ligase [Tissierella praeacuta DSM 18095]|uniref:UDP-N-acetylmuramate--L-alanine ligase n=1 Tax=Tissierella praeacuta DSM 18095 TaxID=1123404 RepID=A0A1M4UMW2_9FIRM|nr:UDP-N-acetylmuramate--L-alanine ligase [Tissierella praeacuta]SHE58024.1 UDP-N-acetylmuramate--L-alanine ligase [Tissierella praeacuta DSM 18095]SUP03522.1 UDP-N-acetylmuramate--L-alanine ligase [Tissierella praeacuta]